jgi:anti-sigma factor RsiW
VTISDEILMAYLDNELAPEERARVASSIAADPEVKRRLERQERLHAVLAAAFDPAVKQAVPERLVAVAKTTPASPLWRARAAVARWLSPSAPSFAPALALVAATLLIGVGLGLALTGPGGSGLIAANDGALVAQGELARVLEERLASEGAEAVPRVGVSFRSKEGAFCRTFETGADPNVAGLACRGADDWVIHTVTRAAPIGGAPYEVAGGAMPPALRNAVAELIDGAPLDAEGERRARDGDWLTPR